MTIKEEPQIIEFSYKGPNDLLLDGQFSYDLKYYTDETTGIKMLEVKTAEEINKRPFSDGSLKTSFPLEFFTEVVAYLGKKEVVKGQTDVPGFTGFSKSLLPPKIVKKDESKKVLSEESSTIPFTSFEVTDQERKEDVVSPPQVEIEASVIDRPVIRSRIKDLDDPMGAEKEAASLRGSVGEGKRIKRKED